MNAHGDNYHNFNNYINSYKKYENSPIKILLGFYKGYLFDIIKTFIALVIQRSPVWIIPIITANIINAATYPAKYDITYFIINVAVGAFFLVQNLLSTFIATKTYSKIVRNIESGLRGVLVRKLQQLSIAYHKEIQSGKLLSKIMRDVENIEMLLIQAFNAFVFIVLDIVIAITVTTLNSPVVLIFFSISIPIAIITISSFRKGMSERNAEYRKEMEETQAAVSEMVELIPITRAHGLENVEIHKMDWQLDRVKIRGHKLDKLNGIFGALTWVIFQLFQLLCLAFTSYLAYRGKITIGEVILYQTYFSQIVSQVASLINMYPLITRGVESINSVGEIVFATNVETYKGKKQLSNMLGDICFEEVSFRYNKEDRWILKDINFTVKAGECIAIVGSSGAGKSTILNLIIGFEGPNKGKILLDGEDMSKIDLRSFRKKIAVVPQSTILFSGTIRDNIAYGMEHVSDDELNQVIKDVGLDDMMNEMAQGMNTTVGEHGSKLSGGQKQRISIARAMIRKPNLIIFDEATSALDSISEKKVQESMEKLMNGRTTFIVAHRLSTIINADKIIVLENGRIAEMGNYQELMKKKGVLYNLKKLQE